MEGWIGHDFSLYFSELLYGRLFFYKNGWALPHYTPYLCGGIPFLADPQSGYYSLPQWLSFLMPPLKATYLSLAVFYILAYVGWIRLLKSLFHYSDKVSHLTGLVFVSNGFAYAHFLVGHLTHHPFLLTPWLLYFLMKPKLDWQSTLKDTAAFSLCISYFVYSGAVHILTVLLLFFLILSPMLIAYFHQRHQLQKLLLFSVGTFLSLTLMVSGKLVASFLYSAHFHSMERHLSPDGIFQTVFRFFWFIPSNTPLYLNFGNLRFGPWEYVGFLSKLCLPAALLSLWVQLRRPTPHRMALFLACLVALLVVFLSLGIFGQNLPFIKNYHNPIKWLAALIPLFCLGFANALNWLEAKYAHALPQKTQQLIFFFLSSVLFLEFGLYSQFFVQHKLGLTLPLEKVNQTYQAIRSTANAPPVTRIVSYPGYDLKALARGESSLRCYEPLFGYRWEKVYSQLKRGPTFAEQNGHYNMNHPGCFLYPNHFQCQAWDRVPKKEGPALKRFLKGETPSWGVPVWQTLLYALNFFSIFFSAGFLVYCFLRRPITPHIGSRKRNF